VGIEAIGLCLLNQ